MKEEYLQRAEAGLPGEEADCLPPTCSALGAGTKVQKATCDLSSSLTYQRFPPTQLLHISRDVHFQRRAGGVGERGDEYRGERKYMHMLGADLVPPPPKKNYTILHPLGLFVCTYLHDSSKNRGIVHCAAVPAAVPELVLALLDAHLGAFADVMDVVLVELTQLLLALRQAHQLAAQRLRADDVSLRDQQRVHGQRPGATGGTQMKRSPNEQLTTQIR